MTSINNKHQIKWVCFYICNECNFNCTNCNRFNNFYFSGSQRWKDFEHIYQAWAEKIDIEIFEISGGEPLLNNDWFEWFQGIHKLWPNAKGQLYTNGSLMNDNANKFDELYDLMKNSHGKLEILYNLLNADRKEEAFTFLKTFLKNNIYPISKQHVTTHFINSYNQIKGVDWPVCNTLSDFDGLPLSIKKECENVFQFSKTLFIDKIINEAQFNVKSDNLRFGDDNDVFVSILTSNQFWQSAIIPNYNFQTFTLHNNDPSLAHELCNRRPWNIPRPYVLNFIEGKAYKCGPSRLLQDFDNQFILDISEEDRQLIHSYIPANINMDDYTLTRWFDNLHKELPNCKFCTIDYVNAPIYKPGTKKIMFKKKTP